MKQTTVVPVLALLIAALAVVVVTGLAPPPDYTTREDENSYFIQQVGMFAVNVYKMGHMCQMYYKYTVECWSKPAGGGANYYWMVLTATNSTGAVGQYVSTVWGIPGSESKTWKLLSFSCTS
ncbi:hypothetical protein PR202_gb07930 [Eleusine coracana subsp. coracana]|uniref:Cysteine proteinase inhibitor n=1 Tax=Eleusine coracana subsp. coracana TaxID=191504 RepID=A0AAV5EDG4_ELECO|nr:hypothetical protein QOZ80_2BG0179090 [Eleusine coracana subsp. coracana]GJN20539.1 hypothetical protein PR202_gb07930 [Eleusine coracana subsp. coracana]